MRDVNARFGYAQFNSEAPVDANLCCLFLYKFIKYICLEFLGFVIFEKPFFLTRQEKKMTGDYFQHPRWHCKVLWSRDFPTSPCKCIFRALQCSGIDLYFRRLKLQHVNLRVLTFCQIMWLFGIIYLSLKWLVWIIQENVDTVTFLFYLQKSALKPLTFYISFVL